MIIFKNIRLQVPVKMNVKSVLLRQTLDLILLC
jgi:hypothetical protein